MKLVGILLLLGGAIFGFIGLGEFSNAMDMQRSGNPFSNIDLSLAFCELGVAATAGLCGIGFLIAPGKPKVAPVPSSGV